MSESHGRLPARWSWPRPGSLLTFVALLAFLAWSLAMLKIRPGELWDGFPAMLEVLGQMRPNWDRFVPISWRMLETLQMALVGCAIGVVLSVPVAVLAAKNHAPNRFVHALTRGLVTFVRTVPDLVWALLFIVWVGLGPFAGVLTLVVETIGFCGRFFADAFEETDQGPPEALTAMGARNVSVFACATLPAALPAMTNTALFAVEKAVRASVVLGLVGAGGIGVELKTAMEMFQYDRASMIIAYVFAMVFAVERLSGWLRSRI
ncbi:MAG: phosphonate ABC transporter, permease protein PhnE [Planctomycetes bacterium]|nr:phosphonate ABC transporter, permease protein PhnE [Planctomycetota bacterium]